MRKSPTLWSGAAVVSALAAGCAEPEPLSGLVPAGPPTVSAVIVTGETASEATYCNPAMGDHTPRICAAGKSVEPVGDVRPLRWTARVVWKELLDPSIEDIDAAGTGSIRRAGPFAVTCGDQPLPYDGFYDPSGNHETQPPGPALVIHGVADPAAATGATCRIAIVPGVIHDKDREAAPDDVAFEFAIAPLHLVDSAPADGAVGVAPGAAIALSLNSAIDPATLAGSVALSDAGGAPIAATVALDGDDPTRITVAPDAELARGTAYRISVTTGVRDALGGPLAEPIELAFTTAP